MSKPFLRVIVMTTALFAALPAVLSAANVDLSVFNISGTPDPITLNTGDVTFSVQVFNASATAGTNTVLTNTLPLNSTYVSSSATGGGSCSQSGGTVTCNWSSIPASNNFFATIVVTPTSGGALTLSSSVSGTEPDPNAANNTNSKSVTVNSQIDLRVFNVSGTPDPITLNTGNVTYTVQVFNQSTSQGTNTVLTSPLPVNSTYVSSSATGGGTCSQSGGTVTCNWASIPASNNFFATIVVIPTAGGPLTLSPTVSGTEPDPNTADNTFSKTVTVNSQIDLRVFNVSGTPDPITLNTGNVTYTVQVFNQSTSQGTNTVLTSPLPVNSTYVSSSATGGGTCSQSGGTVTCNWASIPASNNFFATIVVTPTAGGPLTLSPTVSGTEPDPNTADNTGSKTVTVNSQIDLRVFNVSGTPDPITLNTGNVTYTVQVFNQSTSQGTNTVLTSPLPVNSTYVSSSATGGGTCSQSGGTVTCNWASIPASNNFFATIVVTPTAGGPLTLSPTVSGTEPDPNTADNTFSKTVTVNSQIDLRVFNVSGTPDPITLNTGDVTYTVQVFNQSTSQGTNTVLTSPLPVNSTYVSSSATGGGTCSQSGGTVTCNWASIPASNNFFATIVVTPTAGGPLTLSPTVSGTEPDPNTADNTGSKTVTVNSQIDLQVFGISGTPDPITFNTGNVTFSVQVFNQSTSQGTNAVLTATLPSNSSYVSSSATGGGTCTQSGATVTCNWSSIPASNSRFGTIVVTPTLPGTLTLSATVSGTEPDPNTSNNSGSKTTTVTPTTCTPLPSGEVAWYRAEGDGVDALGVNNATATGGAAFNTGKVGQAFSLNGATAYLSAPDNAALQLTTFTIEGWFFLTGATGTRTIVSKTAGTGSSDSFIVYIAADGTITAAYGDLTSTNTLSTSTIPTGGAWHHFAYTYNGASQQLYLDGGLAGSGSAGATIAYDTHPMLIGADADSGSSTNFFPGLIDELTLYNRVLSSTEIQAIFGAGTFGKCYSAPGTPSISAFAPSSGATGSSIVITGTGFAGITSVMFNGVSAPFTVNSATQITATVPGTATSGFISVNNAGGAGVSGSSFTVVTANHWTNAAGGNWSTGSNWSLASAPTAANDVIIDAAGTYTVTLDVTPAFNTLTIGGGATGTQTLADTTSRDITFTNQASVLANGVLTLSSGRLLGAGGLSVNGALNWNADSEIDTPVAIAGSASLNISGSGTRSVNGGTINNSGTVNWGGANNISVYNAGVINNLGTGLFSVTNDQLIDQHCCSAGQAFNNAGTFRKTVATGTTTIQNNGFNNSGTIDIQSGTFNPTSGGTSTGVFNATATGAFLFSTGSYALATGATLTGAGNFQITGGQLNVSAAGVTADHITLSGGNLNINSGASVATSAAGVIDWSADATISGAGALTIGNGGTLNVSGFGTRSIDGGTINNNGTINWSGTDNISVYDGGVINNLATGLFSVKNDQLIYQHCCTPGQAFNNVGTFRKTVATGTTQILNNGFNNSGTVDIQSGTFNPTSGGTSTSVFHATAAGTFLFSNGTYTLGAGATLTGSGNFQNSGGQLLVNATGVAVDHLTMSGGTLNIPGSISTSPSGVVDWNGDSTLTGAGSLTITGGGILNISGFGTRSIDGGTLNNNGTVNWSGANNISVFNAGVINNQVGGLFSLTNDQLLYQHCCTAGQAFNNAGTFRKTVATGTTTIQSNAFANSGTIEADSGVIAFNSTFTTSGTPTYGFGIGSATTFGRLTFANPVTLTGALVAAPINSFVPQGGSQYTIITFPSGSAAFAPKTLTYGSSPVRSFADTYPGTSVELTASGPVITTVSPNHGQTTGGTPVTITGSGFVSGGSLGVTFGGTPATSVTVVNASTITCTTPAHIAGLVDAVVTNGDGQPATAVNSYTFGTFTADVGIAGSAPATVANSGNFTYATLVTNNGPSSASSVVATITLPPNVTLSGSPTSTQGSCSGTTTITCTIGTLGAGNTATQTLNLTATATGSAVLQASVAAIESDPVPGNNSAATSVGVTGSSTMVVTTNADSGTGSLRQALLDANNAPVCPSPCTIAFNLPGGQQTITPPTSLPAVTAANVAIDATTQPGYAGVPRITLDGSSNAAASTGLQLSGGHDTVKGLSIVTFQGSAITIDTAGNDVISANYLGIQTDGSTAGQNAGEGVLITTANNTVGGNNAAASNLISGNFGSGVVLQGTSATGNAVIGNTIGLNAAQTAAVPNQTDGVQILFGASNNTIGGTTAAARNVISGNHNSGIYIAGNGSSFCTGNVITGNFIGTNGTSIVTIGNTAGIYLGQSATSNTIGGLTAAEANTIDFASGGGGILLVGSGNGNTILGNTIRDGAAGMSIDLENNGPTPNDAGDADTGSNGLQNFPQFLDATLAGSTLTTHFNVDSASVAGTHGIRVELFRSDPTGVQRLKPLGSQCFAGNSLTAAAMTIPGAPVNIGDHLAGTATSYTDSTCATPSDGTSEVSTAIPVAACTPPAAAITPSGPTTFCSGGSVTLTASAGAAFQWRNFGTPLAGSTSQQLVVTTGGSYSVTVTNAAGCSATSPQTSVTVNSAVNVTISGPTTFCAPGSVVLTANPSGGSGSFASFQWSLNGSPIGGATSSTFSATAGGSYSVTVTDSNGCSGTSAPTTVTANAPPPATISAPASVCANSVVSAGIAGGAVAGATYTWTVGNGTLQTGQGTASITFSAGTATPVSLSVVATRNSCSANGSASVTVGAFIPTITSSGPPSFCAGGSVTLTSSAGASYQWLLNGSPIGGATAQSFVATAAGNYSVSVTTGAGCNGTSATTAVTQTTAPSPTITPSGPTTFCSGGSVTLNSSAAATYQWLLNGVAINSATGQTFNATASGSYSVTVTNGGGCTGTSPAVSVTVTSATTAITAPSSAGTGSSGNIASVPTAPAGSTYNWTITGGTITSGNGTPSIAWTAGNGSNATLGITVTTGSCTATASATVSLASGSSSDLALTMTAGPNPVNSAGTVTFTLNVANNGPDVAQNVRVANNLFGVTAPSASGNGWSCSVNNLTIVCTLPSLASGPATPLTITATAGAGSSAGDSAAVAAATGDPNGNNNNASATININTQPTCNNTAPAAISPAAGATNVANPVNFSWSAAPNATNYDLWIASSGNAAVIATTTQATSAAINLPSGPSTWYVVAHFTPDCPMLSSSPRDLTVAALSNCTHPAPQLLAPPQNGVVSSPVSFSWTPVAQAIGYRVWVAIDGGAAQDAGSTNGATLLTVAFTGALTGTSVSWHVDALFAGCDPAASTPSTFAIVSPDPCAHATPALLAPAPDATLPSSAVDFHWTAVAGANGYRVWASIGGAPFASLGTTAATTLHATFTSGAVAWYVEALFNGCASVASTQQSFTIPAGGNCNNSPATSLAPSNDVTLTDGTVDFAWSPAANAIGYELWLSFNNGSASVAGTTTNATTLRRTIGAGNIEWFVRAQFNGCDPVESAHARFTFSPPANCPLVRPILTAPVDGAPAVIAPFDLRWSNVPGATQYKVWLASGDALPAVIGTTTATHLDNQSAPEGGVTWFVEADFSDCPALRSASSSFVAARPLPPCAAPEIPLPRAEGTASTNVEYLIRWTPSGPTGTTQYELQESAGASFTSPLSITTTGSELPFKHVNNGDNAVTYYYRLRAASTCTGARTLFSLPLAVQVLPSNVTDPSSASGSTPADNPQTTHYQLHLGGSSGGKGSIAAAAGATFTATTNQPWLTVSPPGGTVPAEGTTLTVTASTDGLPVGTSSGAVSVTFGSAPGQRGLAALDNKPPSTTTVSINLVQPVAPTAKTAPPSDALIIPAVAHADGINSKFQSDIRVTNSSAQPMKYQLTFMPTGDSGITEGKQTTVDIDPGRTLALDDVLQSWFGATGATGTLEIRPLTAPNSSATTALPAGLANILTFASSRTFNTTANGTFGQYVPAIPFAAFAGRASDPAKSTILSLQQIAQSSAFRTNLGIVEGSGDPASVLVSVFGDNGQKLTEFIQDLKGGQHVQLNSILAQKNVQVSDGRIEIKVVSPVGKVTAYASVLDNLTNDPLLVSPVPVNQTAAPRYVLPGVADINNGIANWQTDVRLFNPSTNIVKATMTFFSQNGGTPLSKDVSLAPGQVQTFDSALRQFFGITNDGGALSITTVATTPLVATARTYNQTSNGTYGQFVPAVTANGAAALGTRPLQILQIEESDRYRTNVGFAEVTGKAARIEVTAVPSDSKVAASTQIDLAPNQFIQYTQLLKSLGLTNMYNARVSVKVISGQGRVTAYASVIDMLTNDPTFVPAQ